MKKIITLLFMGMLVMAFTLPSYSQKKDKKGAQELLPKVYKSIDKAQKRGVIKKNTAARKKSRASALVKSLAK